MEIVWDWKSIGSLLATMMFLRSAARDFLPPELREFLHKLFGRIYSSLRPTATFIIDELDPSSSITNELFVAANSYLSSSPSLSSAPVLRLSKTKHSTTLSSALPSAHSAEDDFRGAHLKWTFHSLARQQINAYSPYSRGGGGEQRYLELKFHQRDREMVFRDYLPFVLEEAERLKAKSRERRLYTNRAYASEDHHGNGLWSSVPFKHPSTFHTLAIDPALRDSICSDLLRFSSRRDYYNRVGRAWKRGYLLHGPPGTGKTSLIAAIANFLEFDLYDLELTAVHSNSHLRKLLVSTSPKSVVVVEDVDCSLDLSERTISKRQKKQINCLNSKLFETSTAAQSPDDGGGVGGSSSDLSLSLTSSVSLSGVLNFVDGLWSSCVGERLIIFTTNHPERLDPALLRPGRMDRKIHLSYCGPAAFRALARNYLEVEGHEMMAEAERLVGEVEVTPAEIAEVFMGCDGDGPDVGMGKVVEELRRKKEENHQMLISTRSADGDGDGDSDGGGDNNINDKNEEVEVGTAM